MHSEIKYKYICCWNNADIRYCIHEQHSGINSSSFADLFPWCIVDIFHGGSYGSCRIYRYGVPRKLQHRVPRLDVALGLSALSLVVDPRLCSRRIRLVIVKLLPGLIL